MRHEVATRRVLYEIPGIKSVRLEKATFPGANGEPLPLEIYGPINPIVRIVAGAIVEAYPDAGFENMSAASSWRWSGPSASRG